MVYESYFIDIGKVSVLECVRSERGYRSCMLKAVGECGEMTFAANVAFSKMYPEMDYAMRPKHLVGHRIMLFDLGVAAFFCQIRKNPFGYGYFKKMKRGDRIVLSDDMDALKRLREGGSGLFDAPPSCRRWVNARGEAIAEPRDFLAKHLAASLCVLTRDVYSGKTTLDDGLNTFLEIGKDTIGCVTGEDFDFMLQWREKLALAARTINHHIDSGDCTPNMSKIDAFLCFYANEQQRIDRLSGIDSFAAHLHDRSMEVCGSQNNSWKTRIGMVESFSSMRFPGNRHI